MNSKSTLKIDQNTPITCCNLHGNQFISRVIAQGFGASVHICLIIGRNYFHVTKQLRKMSIADREHTAGSINSIFPVMFNVLNGILEKIHNCKGCDKYYMGLIRNP